VGAEFPPGFEIIVAAVFGAMIGSFLNVCILRWGAEPKQSVVSPRSRCPRCGRGLAWYDNIPVFSWVILRGRCRNCGQQISVQYPLVELATAGIWAFMAWRHGVNLDALRDSIFGTILLGIAMTDARAYIIPHEFSIGGALIAIGLAASGDPAEGLASLQGALVGAGVVLLIGELSELAIGQEAMGGGDCALMGMVGAFLGWEAILPVLLIGAVISTLLFLMRAFLPPRSWSKPLQTELDLTFDQVPGPGPRRFQWALVLKLLAAGAVPILVLAGAAVTGLTDQALSIIFDALLGAGVGYYAAFLLPDKVSGHEWVRVRGLIGAALGLALGAGLSAPRVMLGVLLILGVLWHVRRVSVIASPETSEGLESEGYLPFGVGLALAAGLLTFLGAMPVVRDFVLEYSRLLRMV
jgi:leader peptidase (prepilin peptidase) / N-methyltransferase